MTILGDFAKNASVEPTLKHLRSSYAAVGATQNEFLQSLGKPHIDSFNHLIDHGLNLICEELIPVQVEVNGRRVVAYINDKNGNDKSFFGHIVCMVENHLRKKIYFCFSLSKKPKCLESVFNDLEKVLKENRGISRRRLNLKSRRKPVFFDLKLMYPYMPDGSGAVRTPKIYPSECRQRGGTYSARLQGKIQWSIDGVMQHPIEKDFGNIPIMVKSNRCHLKNLTPAELVKRGEHEDEWGGYFIFKGHERLIRMLIQVRRNYPVAVSRRTWKNRGDMFSDKGLLIRCVADDYSTTVNVLHFLTEGSARLMISHKRLMFFIPVCLILKGLMNVTDFYIFKRLLEGKEDDSYYRSCVRSMLQSVHIQGLDNHYLIKKFIGKSFRVKFSEQPEWMTDEQICDLLFEKCLLIHLKTNEDKFNLLIFMTQKLFAFVQNKCCDEGGDALMMQEVLTGGGTYQQILKDKLQGILVNLKYILSKKVARSHDFSPSDMATCCKRAGEVQTPLEYFIATGNVSMRYSSGITQEKGLTIVAENINRMRYMSHFKAVHRGSFFVEMRTTEARQLLPDAWGFICPVHTPDGSPCGLLNHLAKYCQVTDAPDKQQLEKFPQILFDLGVFPLGSPVSYSKNYTVLLDGRVIGSVPETNAVELVKRLRILKVEGKEIPKTTEIVLVPKKEMTTQYPGLFLFTGSSRLMRSVRNLVLNQVELIGTFEQVYMDICINKKDAYNNLTTHQELSNTAFLSNLASLIPMPDCNQSPRNMYQCQMGKQSMGTPCHTWELQAETKLYRLLIPSSPLFRPVHYDHIKLDDFPMGVNAVVAVISYTGYDMEDAMIINKSSFERGFGHGSILKSEFFDIKDESYFERDPSKAELSSKLDEDGLPFIGVVINENDPVCCFFDHTSSKYVVKSYHSKETAYVDNVRLCSDGKNIRACITYRVPRNPTVGDKFASRAGQKGICSRLWPAEDLPFSDSGIVPDVVFNPHGFPSRMTIAMMIELMAGKSAAVHGTVHDATPFRFSQNETAIDHFGRLLEAGGYSYYGTEKMYSGVDGREMEAAIFYGIVYYQRLRHMVLDKWQVRSTGPVDSITQQPIKGRRKGGGVRFGEMERDALISHGASALVHDRLFECSDKFRSFICVKCNNLLSSAISKCAKSGEKKEVCRLCPDGGKVKSIEIPYILRYLLIQLAAVNINLKVFT